MVDVSIIFKATTMNGPRNPTERSQGKKDQPSPKSRARTAESDRTLPSRHSTATEKQRERIVNEDEQMKVVNNREDNAQSRGTQPQEENEPAASPENESDRLEAGYDNSEVNPRPQKVN
jgi:hypothetical protein